jgi:hypothetical protein
MRRHVARIAALVLLTAGLALAAEPAPVLSGRWVATAAKNQVLAGTWSAQVLARTPNQAVGSWTLPDEKGNVLMQGTWSARKTPRGWRGTWSARVGSSGAPLSGTWEADDSALGGKKTFQDMLKLAQAGQVQVAGAWRAGRTRGNWWLKGLP